MTLRDDDLNFLQEQSTKLDNAQTRRAQEALDEIRREAKSADDFDAVEIGQLCIETQEQFNQEIGTMGTMAGITIKQFMPALASICNLSGPFTDMLHRAIETIQRDAFARGWRARGKENRK